MCTCISVIVPGWESTVLFVPVFLSLCQAERVPCYVYLYFSCCCARLKHYRAEKQRRARAEWTALVKRAQKHRVDQARRRRRRKQRKQARHPYTQGAAAVTRKGRGSSVTGSEVMSGLSLGGKPRSVASPVDVPVRSRAVTRSTGSTRHTRTKAQSSSRQLHQSNSAKSRDASSPGLSGQHQAASGHSAAGKRDLLQPPSRRSSHRLDKQPSLRRHPDFHSMSRRNSVSRRNLVSRRNSRSQPSNRLSSDVQPASNRDSRTRMRQLLVDCHTAMLTDDLATCSEVWGHCKLLWDCHEVIVRSLWGHSQIATFTLWERWQFLTT